MNGRVQRAGSEQRQSKNEDGFFAFPQGQQHQQRKEDGNQILAEKGREEA